MKYSELYRLLRKNKCYVVKEGAKHDKWYSPITCKNFPVPRHQDKEVPAGTLISIKKAAGVKE